MCRHLGYLGAEVPLASLLLEPPHSLVRQSYAPQEMRGDVRTNADGFGIGWYVSGAPTRYRRTCPLWNDANVPALCRSVASGAVLAAVRSATPGMPVTETACAPFADGTWLFSHNGVVAGWPDSVAELAAELPAAELLTLPAPTDSALLWLLLRRALAGGRDPAATLTDLVLRVARRAPDSRLNLLLTDGRTLYGTAWAHSLWYREAQGGITVASERTDSDSAWRGVPDRSLVVAGSEGIEIVELDRTVAA